MKSVFLLLVAILAYYSVQAQQPSPASPNAGTQFPAASSTDNATFSYTIVDGQNNTFGYDVYSNNKLMIHQTSIPGLPGNEGFKTKKDAEKVALLVIDKIKKGEMPPTVTSEELKDLGVIKK